MDDTDAECVSCPRGAEPCGDGGGVAGLWLWGVPLLGLRSDLGHQSHTHTQARALPQSGAHHTQSQHTVGSVTHTDLSTLTAVAHPAGSMAGPLPHSAQSARRSHTQPSQRGDPSLSPVSAEIPHSAQSARRSHTQPSQRGDPTLSPVSAEIPHSARRSLTQSHPAWASHPTSLGPYPETEETAPLAPLSP